MISVKFGQCIDCPSGNDKPLIAKRCQFHYKLFRSKQNKEKRDRSNAWRYGSKSAFRQKVKALDAWFSEKMASSEPVCENCGKRIDSLNKKLWHGSQHHILEKSLFPSISAHPLNHGVLGMYCCHGQWHSSWEKASKMPFFGIAYERFLLFKDDIAFEERRRIPECFTMFHDSQSAIDGENQLII